jgi:hypothetical protein
MAPEYQPQLAPQVLQTDPSVQIEILDITGLIFCGPT